MSTLQDKITGLHGGKKKRKARQAAKQRYAKAREDAQLAGVIDTTAEGAVRDERVDPKTQSTQPMPQLIKKAVVSGWAVPDEKKPALVQELVDIVESAEQEPHVKVGAFNALTRADQIQYERDNPEDAGKAKGGAKVEVGVQVNNAVDLAALFKAVDAERERVKQLTVQQTVVIDGTATGEKV